MSAAYNAFFQKAQDAVRAIGDAKLKVAEYNEMLTKLKTQDPCTAGFGEKLDALDAIFEEAKNLVTNVADPAVRAVAASIEDLSFFEKRNPAVINAADIVTNSRRSLSSMMGAVTGRIDLRQQYNSCQELKDPESEQENKEDPVAKKAEDAAAENPEPKNSENQSQDDSTASTDTNPKEPNVDGQSTKSTSNPETATAVVDPLLRPNALSKMSSYTYNLTLYMVTPETYNEYMSTLVMPREGAFIIAQSGGITNAAEARALTLNGELGPGKPGLDYFIDDLKLNTLFAGKNGNSSTTSSNISFKIYEPVGFGFPLRLSRACAEVIKASRILQNKKQKPIPSQMLFIVAIRFYGYDENGAVYTTDTSRSSTAQGQFANFERYFPLVVSKITTKLDGRVTTYDWSGVVVNEQFGFGQMYAKINSKMYIEASTVGEAIGSLNIKSRESLLGGLNAEQEALKQKERINTVVEYDVEYEEGSPIPNSKLIDDKEYSKAQAAMTNVTNVQEVTPKVSIQAQSIDTQKKKLDLPEGMSVISVIDQIITKSEYISRGLNAINNQRIQTATVKNSAPVDLEWFVIHPKVKILDWDTGKRYWSVRITYQIKSFKVPYIRTQYVDLKSKYYGPVKRYDYWFTGKNTEVLSYEQSFNNLYYIIQPYSVTDDPEAEVSLIGPAPAIPDSNPVGNDTIGKINGGSKINEVVRDSLYSVVDQATANVRILGDPDFYMETVGGSLDMKRSSSQQVSLNQFYSKRGAINPYGGQIFCEIVFRTAEDYSQEGTGLLDINQQLSFYGSAEQRKILRNQGVIYQLTAVESSMRRGQFQQNLKLLLVPPENLIARQQPAGTGTAAGANASGAGAGRGTADDPRRLDQPNQTAMTEIRTGVSLNSQGRTVNPGMPPQAGDTREATVGPSSPEELSTTGVTAGSDQAASSLPLRTTQVVTPGPGGRPVNNEDATANNSARRVEVGGREDTSATDEETVRNAIGGP